MSYVIHQFGSTPKWTNTPLECSLELARLFGKQSNLPWIEKIEKQITKLGRGGHLKHDDLSLVISFV